MHPLRPVPNLIALGSPRFDRTPDNGDVVSAWRAIFAVKDPTIRLAAVGGDFAVGLADASGRAFLAVDRFAVRTLCYRVVDGTLRFAERADELADDDTPIDPQAIFDYLHFHAIASPRTIFRDIHRLPPGCWARFEQGKLEVGHYWRPVFDPSPVTDFAAARAEFLTLLEQAIAQHLDGGKPGCFLSGGTDSSTVAGMIQRVAARAATYSIGFEAQGYDEMAFARIAARHFGTEHHEYYVTPADLLASMADVAASYDQPFGNSSALPAYYCARMAHDDGVRRILAGDGGDELFGGNARYAKQRVFDAYARAPTMLRRGLIEPLLDNRVARRVPLLRKGSSYVEQARVPMPDRLRLYNLLHRLGPMNVLSPEFLALIDTDAPLRQQREVWSEADATDALDRTLAYDWRYTLAESDLPKVRGTTQLAGVEVAFPMLDDRLLAFSMRLPPSFKLRGLRLRWFFKEALRGFLPDEIITKPKQGFGLPFGVWATRHDGLQALARDALGSLDERGLLRAGFVDRLLHQWLPAHPGYYGEMVWILTMLELWLRRHRPAYRLP